MHKRHILLLSLLLINLLASAQKKKVEYTGTYEIPPGMAENAARGICLERAKSEAIANEFSTLVRHQSTVSLFNDQSQSRGEAFSHEVNTTIVPGIWLGDEKGYPKFERMVQDNRFVLKVTVKGWASQHNNTKIPLDVKVLRKGTDPSFASATFRDGDQMYLWMRTPVRGHVCVYLYDHQTERAYCLLPYSESQEGSYAIEANKDYVFFSPEKDKEHARQVDRLVMTSSTPVDYNMLYVIFSPNEFAHANAQYDKEAQADGLTIPRSMNYRDFMKWKAAILTADEQTEERSIMLQIKKD